MNSRNSKKGSGPRRAARANPSESETFDELVRFRVTSEQKRLFEEAAARDGRELSNWLRLVALKAAGAKP